MARRKVWKDVGNSRVTTISWKSILGAASFGRGFKEVQRGLPFNDDGLDIKNQWHYERGRLFGCVYKGQLKNGRTVLTAAIYAAAMAYRDKVFT